MSGVLMTNGIQYERCNECAMWIDIRSMRYEKPSEEFPHGRDLCDECMGEKESMHEYIAKRIGLEVGESKTIEFQGKTWKMTRTQ